MTETLLFIVQTPWGARFQLASWVNHLNVLTEKWDWSELWDAKETE